MAKAKRSVASKSSKRRKRNTMSARRKAAKRAAPKKARSNVCKATRFTQKSAVRKKQSPKTAARKALRRLSNQTIATDTTTHGVYEPSPSAVPATEHEVVRTTAPQPNEDSETKEE